jgi:uncharacterized membrane protein
MTNKNNHVVIAYFADADAAGTAADHIKQWDKADKAIKLGGIGILTWDDGKVKTRKVGRRATGTGAKWGVALGAITGILSGGVTLIGGAVAGAAGGAVLGSLRYKNLGLTDEDKARLEKQLQEGGVALVIMADEDEVAPTKAKLADLGGDVEDYVVPEETMSQVEEATDVENIEGDTADHIDEREPVDDEAGSVEEAVDVENAEGEVNDQKPVEDDTGS